MDLLTTTTTTTTTSTTITITTIFTTAINTTATINHDPGFKMTEGKNGRTNPRDFCVLVCAVKERFSPIDSKNALN